MNNTPQRYHEPPPPQHAPGHGALSPTQQGHYPAPPPGHYPAPPPGYYPAPPHGHYAPPPQAAPVNIVVQNTQSVGAHSSGLVRVADRKKSVALILALLLGGLGFHRFYLGQTGMGLVYLFFSWTFIPAFIALFEALVLLLMSKQEFDMKYNIGLH